MALDQIKQVLGQGARANKYRVYINFPSGVSATTSTESIDTLCKSANFPTKSIGVIEIYEQGRKFPIAGDTAFESTWDVVFHNTPEHNIRRDIQAWMNFIDNFAENTSGTTTFDYMVEMRVAQLDLERNETVEYTFFNVWPSNIAEVEVNDETADTVTETTVTFTFSHWEITS